LYLYGNEINNYHKFLRGVIGKIFRNRNFQNIEKREKQVIAFFEILVRKGELSYIVEDNHVTELYLAYQDLSRLPNDIAHLRELKVLDLKGNKIKGLPQSFFKLKKLTKLDISLNPNIALSGDIAAFEDLKELGIGSCHLPSILEKLTSLISIRKLNLSGNRINQIHPNLSNLINLEYLDLSYNNLEEIKKPILELKNLKELNLAGNKIKLIPDRISNLKKLEELNLNFNNIGELPLRIILLGNLKSLYMIHNHISHIPHYLFQLKSLKKAHFTSNNISMISGEEDILKRFDEFYILNNPLPNHIRYKFFKGKYDRNVMLKKLKIENVYSFKKSEFKDLFQINLIVGTNNSGKSNFFKILDTVKPFLEINENLINTNASYEDCDLRYKFKFSDENINHLIELIKIKTSKLRFLNFDQLSISNEEISVKFYKFLKNLDLKLELEKRGEHFYTYISYFGFLTEENQINLIRYPKSEEHRNNINLYKSNWNLIQYENCNSIVNFKWELKEKGHVFNANQLSNSLIEKIDIEKFDFVLFLYDEIINFFNKTHKIIEHRNFESKSNFSARHNSIIYNDGQNFPDILELFIHEKRNLHLILKSLIKDFYPEIKDLWSEAAMDTNQTPSPIIAKPFINELNQKRYFNNLGKGIHQILIILTHLLQLEENFTLLIEEPELFIHPQQQKILYDIIYRFTPFHQIFITTHSPFILNKHKKKLSIHQIMKDGDESIVNNIKNEAILPVLRDLGVRPSDVLMNNGFLLVEGERDISLFEKLFERIIQEKSIELIPFYGKTKLHFYADHEIMKNLIERGFRFRVILDKDEGNLKIYNSIRDPVIRNHILLLPVREIENLYVNPDILKEYLEKNHIDLFSGGELEVFIEEIHSDAVNDELLWESKIKTFIDRVKFRFSQEEKKELISTSSMEEFLNLFEDLISEKYFVSGIIRDKYETKFQEVNEEINSEEDKWKILDGKKIRKSIMDFVKDRKKITINLELIEELMKDDKFTNETIIKPIESYFK
ncbi:MAG: AAA family ATPase, partial [Candidatus Lokiarchaeota archaeon]|nr:AAA family ATPase [Candidatus Lokiarchaeota archaeon]